MAGRQNARPTMDVTGPEDPVDHAYEEIRDAALDVLSGRVKPTHGPQQYETLRVGVSEALARRDEPDNPHAGRRPPVLSPADNELFLEVFWDLFRQGIITLGYNDGNREFPFFRLTQWGRRQVEDKEHFFPDAAAFEAAARERIKRADPATIRYLGEAMRAYRAEAHTAAVALIGVAVEHLCERALQALAAEPDSAPDDAERNVDADGAGAAPVRISPGGPLLKRMAELKEAIDKHPTLVPPPTRDVAATHLIGVMSILGAFRDEQGCPRAEAPDREHVYVLLKATVDYAGTLIDMAQHFAESRVTVVTRARSRAGASA